MDKRVHSAADAEDALGAEPLRQMLQQKAVILVDLVEQPEGHLAVIGRQAHGLVGGVVVGENRGCRQGAGRRRAPGNCASLVLPRASPIASPSSIPSTRDQGMGAAWAGGWLSKKSPCFRLSRSGEANSELTTAWFTEGDAAATSARTPASAVRPAGCVHCRRRRRPSNGHCRCVRRATPGRLPAASPPIFECCVNLARNAASITSSRCPIIWQRRDGASLPRCCAGSRRSVDYGLLLRVVALLRLVVMFGRGPALTRQSDLGAV